MPGPYPARRRHLQMHLVDGRPNGNGPGHSRYGRPAPDYGQSDATTVMVRPELVAGNP